MDIKKELQEKIKFLQKQIDMCDDDNKALSLQQELIDLLSSVMQNKEILKNILK